ncbi:MAG TPA: hypothetical protein VJL29_12885 [Thermoguttaceae bacterium]|nr:hypothetical protein [Thermoguttaceae bacterium]
MCDVEHNTGSPSGEAAGQPSEAECPEIRSAADAVRLAKLELEKAQKLYDEVRQQAAEQIEKVRETTVGDLIDGTLEAVRKRPAVGLSLAALAGFFLGRLFRR